MNKITKDALILFAITMIAGICLGFVHHITLDPIAAAKAAAKQATYQEVYPEAASFAENADLTAKLAEINADPSLQDLGSNVSVDEITEAFDASGSQIGYLVAATAKGYGGPVQLAIGVSNEQEITGIGFLSISETPGLGMKAKDEAFTSQFPGMPATALSLTKLAKTSEDQIAAISGATYTSKAVCGASNAAIYAISKYIR